MVYLVDPQDASVRGGCVGVAYPMYGIPPCNSVCPTDCLLIPCPVL
jgi:hypothetical protein